MLRGPRQRPRTGSGIPLPRADGARRTAVPTSRPYALPVPSAPSATQRAAARAGRTVARAGPPAVSAITRRARQALASRRADASTIHAAAKPWHPAVRTFPGAPARGAPARTRLPGRAGLPGRPLASGIVAPAARFEAATRGPPGHICDL